MQDPPHLLQCEPRIRHMIKSVTTYDQIGTAVQQGKIFGSQSQMYGSAAHFIFDQHSELLIDIQEWVDRDFDGARKRGEVTGAAAAETHDGLAFGPPHVSAQVVDDLLQQEPRIREPLGIVGAAEKIAAIFFMVEEPANFIQITRVGQIRDLRHRSTSEGRNGLHANSFCPRSRSAVKTGRPPTTPGAAGSPPARTTRASPEQTRQPSRSGPAGLRALDRLPHGAGCRDPDWWH